MLSEISQRKIRTYVITYMWNPESKIVHKKGEGQMGKGIKRYKLICIKLKNREAWRAAVHGVAKNWMQFSNWTTTKIKLINYKDILYSTGNITNTL